MKLVAGCVLLPVAARAQSSLDSPYPEGFALNVFEPAPAGDRFFGVPDASSYRDGKLRVHVVGDYALGDVVQRTDDVTGQKAAVVSRELYVHAGAAYPITDFLHAHASVPFAAHRAGDTAATPESGKLGDIRLGLRANVVPSRAEAFAFGPAVDVWLPTGSEDHLTGDGALRVNPKLGASGRVGAFVYAASAGYLVRKKIDTGSLETGDAFTFGAAAGVVLWDRVQVGPEIFGNRQVSPRWNDTEILPLSALFGAKVRIADFVAGVAGGPGLSEAPGVSPRVVLSLAFAPETYVSVSAAARAEASTPPAEKEPEPEVATHKMPPLVVDGDGDGIGDDKDACPDKLGDASDDPMLNGCPKARIADGDGDGVRDEVDACPEVAGIETIDTKTNGCPEKKPEPPPTPPAEPRVVTAKTAAPASGRDADVTFAGFHVLPDGTSRLTVQFTAVPTVSGFVRGTTAEYVISGARIPSRNNKNPLLARHFGAEVLNARLVAETPKKGKKKPAGGKPEARLVVVTREAVTPEHRLVQNPDGTATLIVDFPRPTKPPPPEPSPKAPQR